MDLSGKTYGEWEVLHPSPDKKYYYTCKCSCGKIKDVNASALRLGKSLSCGHLAKVPAQKRAIEVSDKMIGMRFGRLVVVDYELTPRRTTFISKCDCGNLTRSTKGQLDSGKKRSCGCLKSELAAISIENTYQSSAKAQQKARIDGTNAFALTQKTSKNNATGHKGVSKMKNGRYRAYINVARKQIHLGTFRHLQDAVDARKAAEEKYYQPILDKYKHKK